MDIIDRRKSTDLKIAVCIFPCSFLRNDKLKVRFTDFTQFYVNRAKEILNFDDFVVDSIEQGMDMHADKYDHILFLAAGVRLYDESLMYDLVDMIEETLKPENQDYLAGAHILDWGEKYYELHHQFILVNAKSWKKVGRPFFGSTTPSVDFLPIIERSEENFHDDYTPLWVKPSGKFKDTHHERQGWNFIKVAFENNLSILNWDKTIRNKRTYYYPESDSERFLECIENKIYDKNLNINQKRFLNLGVRIDDQIWALNSERINLVNDGDEFKCTDIDTIILPAAGLKPLSAFKQGVQGKEPSFIFYDFSKASLDWMAHLYGHTSENFEEIIMSFEQKQKLRVFRTDSIISHTGQLIQQFHDSFKRSVDALGGPEKFIEYLRLFRSSEVKFIHIDLINNFYKLLPFFEGKKNIFSLSNIYCTDYSNAFVEKQLLHSSFYKLLNALPKITYITGFTPNGKFISNIIEREQSLVEDLQLNRKLI